MILKENRLYKNMYLYKSECAISFKEYEIEFFSKKYENIKSNPITKLNSFLEDFFNLCLAHNSEHILLIGPSSYKTYFQKNF